MAMRNGLKLEPKERMVSVPTTSISKFVMDSKSPAQVTSLFVLPLQRQALLNAVATLTARLESCMKTRTVTS